MFMSIREITQRLRLIGLILRHESMSSFTTMELNSSRLRGGGEKTNVINISCALPQTNKPITSDLKNSHGHGGLMNS